MVKAVELFNKARLLDMEIDTLIEESQSIRDMATRVTSTINDMPGAPLKNNDRFQDTMISLIDYERKINSRIDELVNLKQEINDVIGKLPRLEHRIVLTKRYLQRKRWEQIAVEMKYEERQVRRFKTEALNLADQILSENVRECPTGSVI
jgi:DNA repair exonuclease SbcCD ATPase subunit